jgi:flavin reductase (DIM6/NTAB) family NADH-FMN oxidoreductase RutF
MSISLDPPLIAISIADKAKMLPKIRAARRFAVSILAHGTEQTAWHFAGRPDEQLCDPFDRQDGLPVIRGAVASFTADVVEEVVAGDHMIFIGRVKALSCDPECKPLMFFQGRFGGLLEHEHRSDLH